jgi:hypothetical protein
MSGSRSLSGQFISGSFRRLLQVPDAGVDGVLRDICDGEGDILPLRISQVAVEVTATPTTPGAVVPKSYVDQSVATFGAEALAIAQGETVDVLEGRALTSADAGKRLRYIGTGDIVLTLPGDLALDTAVEIKRAPGAGTLTFSGLVTGGVSNSLDHTSVDVGGTALVRREPGHEGVNGGNPYWSLFGETAP